MFRVRTLSRVILFCLFLFSIYSMADIFYIPHIHTGSDAWETYLIVENPVYSGSLYKLTLYDENGNIVTTQRGEIPFGEEVVIPLRTLGGVSGIFETNGETVRVRVGYIAKDELGGGTAEFSLPSILTDQAIFSLSNYYNQLTWSGFALFNGSNRTINVSARTYGNGQEIATRDFSMEPKTKIVDYFDTFFNLNSFTEIDSVVFTSDYPGLTGVVISGKENDKLLFSPSKDTNKFQFLNITRKYEGYVSQTNFVMIDDDLFTIISHNNKNYLKRIYGNSQNGFDEIELSGDFYASTLLSASNSNDFIILGTDNSGNFIARKIDTSGNTLWETTLGTYPTMIFFDPDLLNIVGQAINGTVIVAFHDNNSNTGIIKAIDESNGTVINTRECASTGRFFKAFIGGSGNEVGIAWIYQSNNKYYLQFMFYDSNGSLVKQIFGQSPVAPDSENIVYDAFQYDDKIFCCFGTKINDGSDTDYWYYSTYLMIIPYSNSDLSNPLLLCATYNSFLRKSTKIYSAITPAFENDYLFAWVMFTSSPYFNSISLIANIDERNDGTYGVYMFIRDLPYRIISAYGGTFGFIVSSAQYKRVGNDLTSVTTVVDKELWGQNMLNY